MKVQYLNINSNIFVNISTVVNSQLELEAYFLYAECFDDCVSFPPTRQRQFMLQGPNRYSDIIQDARHKLVCK